MKNIPRFILDKLKQSFKNNRIIIIVGSRQVGKTTSMEMYQTDISKQFHQFYFNLEDTAHLSICQSIDNLKAFLHDNGVDIAEQKTFLIIDEFQYIKNATKLFKSIYDIYPQTKILASGSSSIEIQKHLKESLAGRKKVYVLYPLSFEEFIRFKSANKYIHYEKLNYNSISQLTVDTYNKEYFREYLTYGGYPKVALLKTKQNKIEELRDIYNSYIQKDIKSLIKGEDIVGYNNLIKILSSQIGNLVNIHELSNTLRMERREVINYLKLLEETFIIKLLHPFHSNKRTEISKMPKLYFLDTGIVNFSIGNFENIEYRPNLGAYVENFIFAEAIKHKPIIYNLYFWRTKLGTEIDFILEGNGELIPVEVKWQSVTNPTAPKNIISFYTTHQNVKRAIVVTKNYSHTLHKDKKIIHFIPAIVFNKFVKSL